jgi:hypothetical protein
LVASPTGEQKYIVIGAQRRSNPVHAKHGIASLRSQ